jgi:hypothetical protein
MSTPDHHLQARLGLRTRSCFNGHDVSPAQLCVVEIATASIVVCGPACETEARARILLRIHGSAVNAIQQALHDWQGGTGQAGIVLALLDRAVAQTKARDAPLELAREAARMARDRHDTALENALAGRIRALSRPQGDYNGHFCRPPCATEGGQWRTAS